MFTLVQMRCGGIYDASSACRCTMKDAKSNHGLFVRGAGTCVTATNCKFTGNGMSGVAVLAQVFLYHIGSKYLISSKL